MMPISSTPQRGILFASLLFIALNTSSAYIISNPMTATRLSFTNPANMRRLQHSHLQSSVSSSSNSMMMTQQTTSSTQVSKRNLSRLEQEFNEMITTFSKYTDEDIQSIRNPRLQALYEGVAASVDEPAVYRSFEVLFEDFGPLRVAGRMIFGKLKSHMEQSIVQRQEEVKRLMTLTGLEEDELRASRLAFLSIAQDGKDGKAVVTKQLLMDTGIASSFVEMMDFANEEDFFNMLGQKEWTFEAFMAALQVCTHEQSCSLEECNPSSVLKEALLRTSVREADPPDPRKLKHMQQYDMMVNKFSEWENFIPKGEGRRLDILRGCFVGAKNEKVVKALKIVYVDYSALRVAGDLIFKLMTALVSGSGQK